MTIENMIEWEVKHFKYTMKIKDGLSLKNKKSGPSVRFFLDLFPHRCYNILKRKRRQI